MNPQLQFLSKPIYRLGFILFSAILFSTFSLRAFATAAELPRYSVEYNDKSNPFEDAKAALALAKKTNKRVLINIGGNWCSWCKKMQAFLHANPAVYTTLQQHFVILKVNVSDSNENAEFMKALPPVMGYPHIYVSKPDGTMLLSKDTAELLAPDGEHYSSEQWLSFINKWKA